MNIGDTVHIKVIPLTSSGMHSGSVITKQCTVYQIYNSFVVLDTGVFKVCAFKKDISGKMVIAI